MSGKPAARKTDTLNCPKCGITTIASGSPDVIIEGLAAARVSDCTSCGSQLSTGFSSTVFINGLNAMTTEAQGTHGDTVISGSPTFIIGDTHTPAPISPVSAMPAHLLLAPTPVTVATDEASKAFDSTLEEEEEEEEIGEKEDDVSVEVTLRIGVFFDGTGNNAGNSQLGVKCGATHPIQPEDLDATCKPYMADPDSSYANDMSNVKKLFDYYYVSQAVEGSGAKAECFRAIYVDGIGTVFSQPDNLLGAGMGRGTTGVVAKVESAFAKIKRLMVDLSLQDPSIKVKGINFDCFGFSRGAAAVRHFANQIALGSQGPLGQLLSLSRDSFSDGFKCKYNADVNVNFVGLFDTVASIGGVENLGYVRSATAPGIKLYLSRRLFPNVIQIAARDERRANFPLSRVKPDHMEITVPGAHSDIGGGYGPESREVLLVTPMQALIVSIGTDVTTTSIYQDAVSAKAEWLAKGWPASMLEIVTPNPVRLPGERGRYTLKRVYAALQLTRAVRGELSRVYLRLMYELAKRKGVRFISFNENDAASRIPDDLVILRDRFVSGVYSTTADEETMLRTKYIHLSANWNPPTALQGNRPRIAADILYLNAPASGGIRVQHPHVPD